MKIKLRLFQWQRTVTSLYIFQNGSFYISHSKRTTRFPEFWQAMGKQIRGIWIRNWITVGSLNQPSVTFALSFPSKRNIFRWLAVIPRSNMNAVTAKIAGREKRKREEERKREGRGGGKRERETCRLSYLYQTTKSRGYLNQLSSLCLAPFCHF